MRRLGYGETSLFFLLLGAGLLPFADLAISALDPWAELRRLVAGIAAPAFSTVEGWSLVLTVAFAVLGVSTGAVAGLVLALVYPLSPMVRVVASGLRGIHELFWALLLMQVFGLGPVTGILAVALPYTGYFAKVFAEIIEEADLAAVRVLPRGTSTASAFFFARLPDLMEPFKTYTLYRLECGLRSTLVLGFIGIPTIGFHLEVYFRQGHYAEAAALLACFYALIGTRRLWARSWILPLLIVASIIVLPETVGGGSAMANVWRFLTADIVPQPLRTGDPTTLATWLALSEWVRKIGWTQALPGIVQTIILGQIALLASALLALVLFPLVSRRFAGAIGQPAGRVLLVVARSTPEYMLAYVLLQILGPSMLPAIIALALHNGAIVGYLMGRQADGLDMRRDAPHGINLYAYEVVPRLYGQFLAYVLYRWEVIVRESAIFGILGVKTLGFYVDGAISELKLDAAVALILVNVILTMTIDAVSRRLRTSLRIGQLPTRLATAVVPAKAVHELT